MPAKMLSLPAAGRWAVLSGAVAIVGDIFLILFYIFQVPRMFAAGGNTPDYLGRINDAALGLQALLLIPVAPSLLGALRLRGPISLWHRIATGAAVISMLVIGVIQFLYAPNLIGVETQVSFALPAWGIIGLWMIITNYRAFTSHVLSRPLAWLGIAVGSTFLLLFPSGLGLGNAAITADADPRALISNPFLIVIFVGFLIGIFGFFVYPFWAVWLGRVILSGRLTEKNKGQV